MTTVGPWTPRAADPDTSERFHANGCLAGLVFPSARLGGFGWDAWPSDVNDDGHVYGGAKTVEEARAAVDAALGLTSA